MLAFLFPILAATASCICESPKTGVAPPRRAQTGWLPTATSPRPLVLTHLAFIIGSSSVALRAGPQLLELPYLGRCRLGLPYRFVRLCLLYSYASSSSSSCYVYYRPQLTQPLLTNHSPADTIYSLPTSSSLQLPLYTGRMEGNGLVSSSTSSLFSDLSLGKSSLATLPIVLAALASMESNWCLSLYQPLE